MRRAAGFTLVELVMVIVIMGIVAVISTQFVAQSSSGFRSTAERQKLAVAASVITEKVSRELRESVPNSVRVLTDSAMNCVEFRPIVAATDYLDASLATSVTSIQAIGTGTAATGRIAVYPISSGDLYDPANPGAMTSGTATLPAGPGAVTITLASAHEFRADAPSRRLYVVGDPVAYCHPAGTDLLNRYTGYSPSSSVSGLPGALSGATSAVVAAKLDPSAARRVVFNYNVPTLTRNGVVTMKLAMLDPATNEQVLMSQEVQIRNVP